MISDHLKGKPGTPRSFAKAAKLESGVNPVAETRKLRTGYHLLTGNCQRSCSSAYWSRLVKRRRALLESNPPRNSQLETHGGRWAARPPSGAALDGAPGPTNGRRRPGPR